MESVEKNLERTLRHAPDAPVRDSGGFGTSWGVTSLVLMPSVSIGGQSFSGTPRSLLHLFSTVTHERDHCLQSLSLPGVARYVAVEARIAGRKAPTVKEESSPELAPLTSHYFYLSFPEAYSELETFEPEESRVLAGAASRSEGDLLLRLAGEVGGEHAPAASRALDLIQVLVSRGAGSREAADVAKTLFFISYLANKDVGLVLVELRDVGGDPLKLPADFFEDSLSGALMLLKENRWLPKRAEILKERIRALMDAPNYGEMSALMEEFSFPVIVEGRGGRVILNAQGGEGLLSLYLDRLKAPTVRCPLKGFSQIPECGACPGVVGKCPLRREWGYSSPADC